MTIAIDRASGKVLGQIVETPTSERHTGWGQIRLLTREGMYAYVPATSVRVERVA